MRWEGLKNHPGETEVKSHESLMRCQRLIVGLKIKMEEDFIFKMSLQG